MSPTVVALVGIVALFTIILIRVPIGFALIGVGVLGYAYLTNLSAAFNSTAFEFASSLGSIDFSTVPLFLLMGTFATVAGFAHDIYEMIAVFVGHRRGGLAYATIGASAAFGVVCGSSTATAATFGRAALPEMLKRGYSASFATGTIAAGGTLKSLIPPAVLMILYSLVAKVFILELFVAAIIPAILTILLNFLGVALYVKLRPAEAPTHTRIEGKRRLAAVKRAGPALLLVFAVFGGLYSGIFTVNEAAAVAAILSFVAAVLRGRLSKENFLKGLKETATATAMLYLILIGAFVFGYFLNIARIPDAVGEFITQLNIPGLGIIVVILLIYMILGAVLDEIAAVLVTLPFVLPVIVGLGYDPIWWGVVSIVVVEIGLIIPPMGIIVFLLHGMSRGISLGAIYRGVAIFAIMDVLSLIILVLFPQISLWLPRALGF